MAVPNVSVQTLAVLRSNSEPIEILGSSVHPGGSGQVLFPSNTGTLSPRYETITVRGSISTVPAVWDSALREDYRELGEALAQLQELDDDDEWKIEAPVYNSARRVALFLMMGWYPAPQILHHGSDSIVFNWTSNANNLYLTISSDKMSALISTPERIKNRIEFPLQILQNPAAALRYLQSDYLGRPLSSLSISPASDPLASVG